MSNKNVVCFYHAGCMDGYGAGWVVGKKFGFEKVEFVPSFYKEDFIEEVKARCKSGNFNNKTIFIVDFSFDRNVLDILSSKCYQLYLFDHHISAFKNLSDYELPKNTVIVFDLDECGTSLTRQQLFPDDVEPWFIKYIKDRDLWQWKLDNTAAFSAAAFNKIFKPEDIESVLANIDSTEIANLLEYGEAIVDDQTIRAKRIIKEAYLIGFEGYQVPIVNCPRELTSDVGHRLCKTFGSEFSITYRDIEDSRIFSLRGVGRVDLSEIASRHGGGGHFNASGFTKDHNIYKYLK